MKKISVRNLVWSGEVINKLCKSYQGSTSFTINGPPCEDCASWQPHVKVDRFGPTGVTLCSATEMFNDFSCFNQKEGKKG